MSILIRNARVIDPSRGHDKVADIAVRNRRIAAIEPNLPQSDAEHTIDATGLIACPGLIDPHVHLREPGQTAKEDINSGSRAAVAGGFTTVCCMPNTAPALDSPELVEWVRLKAEKSAHCRVFPVAAATKDRAGQQITEINLCKNAGAVAISDDGDVVENPQIMQQVLQACKNADLAFMQHCQQPELTINASMHDGTVSARLGLVGWPPVAEEIIIERDIRLNKNIHARYHIQHLSSAGSVEIIKRAQTENKPISAEASPHHIALTHDACALPDGNSYNTNAKMNPPLREQADRDSIIEAIAQGIINILATDHAPHTNEEKAQPFESAPFGIIGLESALAIYIQTLIKPDIINWPRLIEMLTINPAKLCNLDRPHLGDDALGQLAVGSLADITIIDPHLQWTLSTDTLAGKSTNTPFLGQSMTGRAVCTIVNGTIKHTIKPAIKAK